MSPAVEQSLGQVAIGLGDPVRALRARAVGTERRNACRPRKSFRAAARPAPRTNAGAERARRSAPTWNPLLARLPDTGRWTGSERTRAYSRLFSSASTSLVVLMTRALAWKPRCGSIKVGVSDPSTVSSGGDNATGGITTLSSILGVLTNSERQPTIATTQPAIANATDCQRRDR